MTIIKTKLIREDGENTIWCKFFDKEGNLIEKEYVITYDEWDAIKKTRLEKNVWELDIPKTEQDERIEWMLDPHRMIHILRALNAKNIEQKDISFYYQLGSISQEYQEKFKLTPFDFIVDARKAKEVFELMLSN